jgi:hypothetical protein
MDASLLREGKPVILGHVGVETTDGGRGSAAHGRERSRCSGSDEGWAGRLRVVCEDGLAMAIGLESALARDIESDD